MVLILLSCASLPSSADELYGIWARTDDTTAVVLEFWEERDYALYSYPLDEGPAVLSTGEYAIQSEVLVLAADNGDRFEYPLLGWERSSSLELEVDGTPQIYFLSAALP